MLPDLDERKHHKSAMTSYIAAAMETQTNLGARQAGQPVLVILQTQKQAQNMLAACPKSCSCAVARTPALRASPLSSPRCPCAVTRALVP